MKIYCAHPISGQTWEQVMEYYTDIESDLSGIGYEVLHPMIGKDALRNEVGEKFKPADYRSTPVASNHAIFTRDMWMTSQCDVFYLNLLDCSNISIGCMMELAWAAQLRKHVIVVMQHDNIHRHAFVLEASSIIFETEIKAFTYLIELIEGFAV